MDDDRPDDALERTLRALQIVCLALMSGVFTFCAVVVVVFTASKGPAPAPAAPAPGFDLPIVGLALCLLALPASFVIKAVIFKRTESAAPGGDPQAVLKRFRAGTIVASAVCEGSAFALLVLVMISGAAYAAWAAGVLIPLAGMMMHFPTREKYENVRQTFRLSE